MPHPFTLKAHNTIILNDTLVIGEMTCPDTKQALSDLNDWAATHTLETQYIAANYDTYTKEAGIHMANIFAGKKTTPTPMYRRIQGILRTMVSITSIN